MSDFLFLRPQILWLFLPLLLLILLYYRSTRLSTIWESFCSKDLLPYVLGVKNKSKLFPFFLIAAAGCLLIFGLAGPSWESVPVPYRQSQSGLVVLLDLSKSMDAEDMKPSRLQRSIYKLVDILKLRKEGQTALVVFSGDSFVVTPLTDDTETIKALLPALDTGIMPSSGHQADKAVTKAVELLDQAGISRRSILLITPELSKSELAKSVKAAADGSAQVYVLGVGTKEGAPIPSPGGGFLKDENGALVLSALNQDNLMGLAKSTNGRYTPMTANDSDLKALSKAIYLSDSISDLDDGKALIERREDQGYLLVLLTLPIAVLFFRRGSFLVALLFFMPCGLHALSWDEFWKTPDQQGEQLFQQESYSEAKERFQNSDWKGAASYRLGEYAEAASAFEQNQTAEGLYNYGTAKAKNGDFDEALKAYEQVLDLKPDHEDALYNKQLIEDLKQQQQEKQNDSQGDQGQENQDRQEGGQQAEGQQDKQKEDHQDHEGETDSKSGEQKGQDQEQQKNDKSEEGDETESSPESSKDQQQEKDTQERGNDSSDEADSLSEEEQSDLQQQFQSQMDQEMENNQNEREQAAPVDAEEDDDEAYQRKIDDRWLDKVKDDPGGLLRRKFLLQYRQQQRR